MSGPRPAPEDINLTNCDREPIHVPGSIQPFGVLLAVARDGVVEQISANAGDWLRLDPHAAVGRRLEEVAGAGLAQRVASLLADGAGRAEFDATVGCPAGACDVVVTASPYPRGLILELEEDRPAFRDDYIRLFRLQDTLTAQLEQARSSQDLMERVARLIADVTGFHRTMVYRFDPDWNGDIIVEEVRGVAARFLGHHFPHTDIPVQARALYARNRIRVIPDRAYVPVPLVVAPGSAEPLDLSDTLLRSVSPVHLQYLANMGVGATLVMTLMVEEVLWGMLVCHHEGAHAVSPPLRRFCDAAARALSLQLKQHLEVETAAECRRLCGRLDQIAERHLDASAFLDDVAAGPDLLALWGAETMVVALHARCTVTGRALPPGVEAPLVATLFAQAQAQGGGAVHTARVHELTPDLAARRDWIGGALLVPLSPDGEDYLLWLRAERPLQVRWAGKPDKHTDPARVDELTPRRSFELWVEEVRGSALPWGAAEIGAAEHLAQHLRAKLASDLRVALENESTLRRMATHDPLTGLPNRRLLMDRIQTAQGRARRSGGEGFALLFIDLDNFKPINDAYGHAEGDAVLKAISARYREALRGADTLARLGGDEFVAVVEGLEDEAEAEQVARKLLAATAAPLPIGEHAHRVGASIGVCYFPLVQGSPEELLRAADQAMYAAKSAGRGRYRLAPATPHT
ncbi:diguanylate cyclase [Ectothiorhodospiraceae bacterium 2226]|nr:diguanylate cyclase [Ectothiorhodospiraceae bacterium 2226]